MSNSCLLHAHFVNNCANVMRGKDEMYHKIEFLVVYKTNKGMDVVQQSVIFDFMYTLTRRIWCGSQTSPTQSAWSYESTTTQIYYSSIAASHIMSVHMRQIALCADTQIWVSDVWGCEQHTAGILQVNPSHTAHAILLQAQQAAVMACWQDGTEPCAVHDDVLTSVMSLKERVSKGGGGLWILWRAAKGGLSIQGRKAAKGGLSIQGLSIPWQNANHRPKTLDICKNILCGLVWK